MQRAPSFVRRAAAGLAGWLLALASAASAQGGAGAVLLAHPRADAELADVAAGHAAWLEDKLARAHLAVVAASTGQDSGSGAPAFDALRDLARASGATLLVLPELRDRERIGDTSWILGRSEK